MRKIAHTFIYTIEKQGKTDAVKFESKTQTTTEFMVSFLTAPDVPPFTMQLEDDKWSLVAALPEAYKEMEDELLEAAKKFQR